MERNTLISKIRYELDLIESLVLDDELGDNSLEELLDEIREVRERFETF